MTRSIEAVLAEAQKRLEQSGGLDVTAFVSANPEHEAELKELLPVMLTLHREKQWQAVEANTRLFAEGLFGQLIGQETPHEATVGDLFEQERQQTGLSLEEQAHRSGLPVAALQQLAQDRTPVSALKENSALKQLASRAAAPFGALVKEVRRLISLDSLSGMHAGAVFTRDKESSTEAERQALLEKVRKAAGKPPEEH